MSATVCKWQVQISYVWPIIINIQRVIELPKLSMMHDADTSCIWPLWLSGNGLLQVYHRSEFESHEGPNIFQMFHQDVCQVFLH